MELCAYNPLTWSFDETITPVATSFVHFLPTIVFVLLSPLYILICPCGPHLNTISYKLNTSSKIPDYPLVYTRFLIIVNTKSYNYSIEYAQGQIERMKKQMLLRLNTSSYSTPFFLFISVILCGISCTAFIYLRFHYYICTLVDW